jgi:hypothetical protein
MNHPKDSDLLLYVYDEFADVARAEQTRREIERHLLQCDRCAQRIDGWNAVSATLDQWEVPTPIASASDAARSTRPINHFVSRPNPIARQSPIYWMVGIASMIVLGFAIGRWTNPALDRQTVEAMIDERMTEFRAIDQKPLSEIEIQRRDAAINNLICQQLQALQANAGQTDMTQAELFQKHIKQFQRTLQQIADAQFQLREDLQTLAINADSKIKENRSDLNALIRMASY